MTLLNIYNQWKDCNYTKEFCYESFIQFKAMKRA